MESREFNNGVYAFDLPSGWSVFPGIDSGGKTVQTKLHIYKDAITPSDVFTHAGITVCQVDLRLGFFSTRFFYDNTCDIDDVELGGIVWKGYTCTSFGYPYTMLECLMDKIIISLMILMKNGEHTISFDDEDVRKIISTIRLAE